jgi:hypothetical protein
MTPLLWQKIVPGLPSNVTAILITRVTIRAKNQSSNTTTKITSPPGIFNGITRTKWVTTPDSRMAITQEEMQDFSTESIPCGDILE